MFRGLIAIVLCSVLAFPWVSKVAITTNFAINQAEIANKLCQNKNRPALHCNGKCVLMQKLNLTENPVNDSAPVPRLLRIDISSFLVLDYSFQPLQILEIKSLQSLDDILAHIQSAHLADIFHPPRF